MSNHRRPPKPPFDKTAYQGQCRMCGQRIQNGTESLRDKTLHDVCAIDLRIATDPAFARTKVFERDQGQCADCGADHAEDGEWDVEHEIALKRAPRHIKFWLLPSLKTLCRRDCHRHKTARDVGAVAKEKRQLEKFHPDAEPKKDRRLPW